jgi:hypothetical protein
MATFTDKPWDGAASKYKDTAAYCDASLINENTGPREEWVQDKCKLPVQEPDGAYNRNAIRNALARFSQTQASSAAKSKALSRLNALKKMGGIGQDGGSGDGKGG